VENLPSVDVEDDVENDDCGAIENQHRCPYLAHQLLGFVPMALTGVPQSAFGTTTMSIVARWSVLSTTEHNELCRFGLPQGVIPYILWVPRGCIALSLRVYR
jgi:hypothetical protein